jgi:hypothetical protein
MNTTVLSDVEKRYKRFRKNLRKFYRAELGWSRTFKRWEKKKLGHRIKQLKALKYYPGQVNEIINIIRCLDYTYPLEGEISYGNKTVVETAVIIYKVYGKGITSYMRKRFKIGQERQLIKHTAEQAIEELKARGFMNREEVDIDNSLPYMHATWDQNLVYPAQFDIMKTYDVFPDIGVSGYTGIKLPRKYRQ